MALVLPEKTSNLKVRSWGGHRHVNQGSHPWCVEFSWKHFFCDAPRMHDLKALGSLYPPGKLYSEAQKVDEWPGEGYDGTSVRAGAKVLQDAGFLANYHWAESLDDIVQAILEVGPVIVGTKWYQGMFNPGEDGFIRISGPDVGGHAWKLDGVNVLQQRFRMKNSWGTNWGRNGYAFVSYEDMERLFIEDGEACIAVEV